MKKRITAFALAMAMVIVLALSLSTPAFAITKAQKDELLQINQKLLSALPTNLRRPVRPTNVEQAGGDPEKWQESVFQEIVDLTDSLTAGKTTDKEKMKAIFDWVSQNIAYEDIEGEGGAFSAYFLRRAVCEGYASLCRLMGTIAGIPVAEITGYSNEENMGLHGWNAALLDGEWLFFDATWHRWDIAPDFHYGSWFICCDDIYEWDIRAGNSEYPDLLIFTLRRGFQDQCPANLTIPEGVTEVTNFYGCTNLERVTFSNTVTQISGFGQCTNLNSVTFNNGLIEIGNSAFAGCTSLKSVTIPSSVAIIDYGAFSGAGLTSVTIPGSVTQIGSAAFYGCSDLKSVAISSGVTGIDDLAFMDCTGLTDITIPNTVTRIGKQAFYGCTALESVTIPDSVTTIEDMAFFGCTNLKRADIPDSVTSLGNGVFTGCPNLQSVTIPTGMTSIGVGAFQDRTDLTSMVIPDHITHIGDRAFRGCTNLQSVTIPDSVTIIGNSAFWGCTSLTGVTIPSSVTTIEYGAFAGCTGMTSLTIPEGVTSIGDMATPYTLTSITIPSSVTSIGGSVLSGNLKDVYYAGTEEQWKAISIGDPSFPERFTIHYNSTVPEAAAAGKTGFADVPVGAYYEDAVQWAVEQNITSGTSATTFSPDLTCTTAEILTFLWRAKGSPEPTSGSPFQDISSDDYYYEAALWARETGLVSGNAFGGNTPCTRSATVTYLWKLAGSPEASDSGFTDVPNGADYAQAVAWAVEKGVTSGTDTDTFSPDVTCSRGQIVTFLYRDLAK